jgi:hypothetical protein
MVCGVDTVREGGCIGVLWDMEYCAHSSSGVVHASVRTCAVAAACGNALLESQRRQYASAQQQVNVRIVTDVLRNITLHITLPFLLSHHIVNVSVCFSLPPSFPALSP